MNERIVTARDQGYPERLTALLGPEAPAALSCAGNEELLVRVGDLVSPGMEIARLGLSPQGGAARLIVSVHGRSGEYVDPEKYLDNG